MKSKVNVSVLLVRFSCKINRPMHRENASCKLLQTRARFLPWASLLRTPKASSLDRREVSNAQQTLSLRNPHTNPLKREPFTTCQGKQINYNLRLPWEWWESKANQSKLTMVKNENSVLVIKRKKSFKSFLLSQGRLYKLLWRTQESSSSKICS